MEKFNFRKTLVKVTNQLYSQDSIRNSFIYFLYLTADQSLLVKLPVKPRKQQQCIKTKRN